MVYEAVSPIGRWTAERVPLAPRLDTLAGKTICEVSNGEIFRCARSFPVIRGVLQKLYPDAKIIPYYEFPIIATTSMRPETKEELLGALRVALREKGCEAVISQFAG